MSSPLQFGDEERRLRQEKQLLQVIVDNTPDYAFILLTPEIRVLTWNLGAQRIFGYTESEIIGVDSGTLFTPEDRARRAPQEELATALREGKSEDDRWHLRKDGSRFWSNGIMRAFFNEGGHLEGFVKILRDLTDQRNARESLRRSEEQFRLFVENVTDYALIQVDLTGLITVWNPGAQRITGYSERDILGKHLSTLCTQDDIDSGFIQLELERAIANGSTEEVRWFVRKDGRKFWARWVTNIIRDADGKPRAFTKVMRDETERKRAEDRLRASLLEKDVLLQEIHHRVKNNLQVVVSLLSIQASRIKRPDVLSILNETQNRVRAIAGIHETLYSSPDLANISFSDYMDQLIRGLFSFYNITEEKVRLQIETDDIVLDVTQAIPLGLIVNELLTNALKHAFPDGRTGTVLAGLRYLQDDSNDGETLDEGSVVLTVEDDGVGLPQYFDVQQEDSMGIYLVRILTRQLRGTLQVRQNGNTQFRVVFPLKTSE